MFKKILIANRGEIVFRVIRACREKFDPQIRTVAVYSDADQDMPYVKAADEAYCIGPSEPVYSYLNMAKIFEVARSCRADAIHPGYGFLSENKFFAAACEEEGIAFIGPRHEIMAVMGDKVEALKLAREAKVPTLKRFDWSFRGLEDRNSIDKRLRRAEKKVGYPMVVKARGGGGGIGIKTVYSREELLPAINSCSSQAAGSFKDAGIYLEQYLPKASHIEVQILADDEQVLHLFERDCSLQRRNQKLVEESPAEKLDDKTRKRICGYARKIVKLVKKKAGRSYTGAGTIEFLVDAESNAYFLEMNTRLQVEHGVTELITGIDLVEWQIRIAAGEKIPFRQKDIKAKGHAIEARVYPEVWDNVNKGFVPRGGTVKMTRAPEIVPGKVRLDSALDIDDEYKIHRHYETLMLKLICWAENRDKAISSIIDKLDRFYISGTETNIDLLMAMLESDTFRKNRHTTQLLSDEAFLGEIGISADLISRWRPTRNLERNIGILM